MSHADGELGPDEREAVETHLAGCAGCREEFERELTLRHAFSSAARHKAPSGFAARVMDEVGAESKGNAPKAVKLFAEAAVVVILLGVAISSGTFLAFNLISPEPENNYLILAEGGPSANGFSDAFSLDVFEPVPPDSVAGAYLAMGSENDQ